MNAGFRIADGAVGWRNRGALFVCGLLPRPGLPLGVDTGRAGSSGSSAAVGLPTPPRAAAVAAATGATADGIVPWIDTTLVIAVPAA